MTVNHQFVQAQEGWYDRCVYVNPPSQSHGPRVCGEEKLAPVHDILVNLDAPDQPAGPEWAFDPNDMPKDLNAAVFTAVGGASACWQNLRGAGVFWGSKAKDVAEALIAWINAHYEEVAVDDLPRAELTRLANNSHEAHTVASQAAENLRTGIAEVLGYVPEVLNRPGDVELLAELKRRGTRPGGGYRVPSQVEFGSPPVPDPVPENFEARPLGPCICGHPGMGCTCFEARLARSQGPLA